MTGPKTGGRSGRFRIEFVGPSPFAESVFSETGPDSGTPIVASGTTEYKYCVSVNGGPVLDPDVIVDQ